MTEGVNLIKIYCKHFCKYHNVFPVQYNKKIKYDVYENPEESTSCPDRYRLIAVQCNSY
jgi:hypothetical protein